MAKYSGATGRPITTTKKTGSMIKSPKLPETKTSTKKGGATYDKNVNYSQKINELIASGNYKQSDLDKLVSARNTKIKQEGMGNSVASSSNVVSSAKAINPSAYDYITQYTGGQQQAKAAKQFEELVPYQQFVSSLDPYAQNVVNPEAMRTASDLVKQYEQGASQNGGYQFSSFAGNRGNLLGKLERQRQEDISGVQQQYRNQLDSVYKRYSDMYWKDPNLDTFKNVGTKMNSEVQGAIPDIYKGTNLANMQQGGQPKNLYGTGYMGNQSGVSNISNFY